MIYLTEKLLNSSAQQPLTYSPTHYFWKCVTWWYLPTLWYWDISNSPARSIRDYVDTLVDRRSKLIEAAIASQRSIDKDNQRSRYAHYPRSPTLRLPAPHYCRRAVGYPRIYQRSTTSPAVKWIPHNNPTTGEDEYIEVIPSQSDIIDTILEIDLDAFIHTTCQVNDYVLRRYPPSILGGGNPHSTGHGDDGTWSVSHIYDLSILILATSPHLT